RSRIGRLEVSVQFSLPRAAVESNVAAPLALPLVLPAEAQIASQRMVARGAENVTVELSDSSWQAPVVLERDAAAWESFAAAPVAQLRLKATEVRAALPVASSIRKAWVQTWLSP